MCFGNTFIKTDTRKCLEMLEEGITQLLLISLLTVP